MKKLYEFVLEERTGEREYTYYHLVEVENYEQAKRLAESYASCFYDDNGVDYDQEIEGWEFLDGEIILTLGNIRETSKEEWTERQYQRALI